jgi:hypothetical protein
VTWVELIGFCGSALAVWTYWMREMITLRIVAILGCICFLSYGALIHSYPLMLMEATLLPINAYRLFQLLRDGGKLLDGVRPHSGVGAMRQNGVKQKA